MTEFLSTLNGYIWSNALVYLCLAVGIYFSIRSKFVQIRQIPEMIRVMIRGEKSPDGVSSFQALMMSLAGRVGTGNIAGVATAIAFGGPGALFWMWMMAFLGASTSFVECTLGQIYKVQCISLKLVNSQEVIIRAHCNILATVTQIWGIYEK